MKPNTVILGWPYGWRQSEDDRTWHVFLQTVRNVSAARMALLVPKGINFFPTSQDKVSLMKIVSLCCAFVRVCVGNVEGNLNSKHYLSNREVRILKTQDHKIQIKHIF